MCHYLEYVWVMRLALELGCVCRIFNTLIEKIAPITDRGTCIDRIFDICFSDARCGTSQRLHANDWHYHKRITDWSSSRKQINTKVFAVYQ